MISKIQFTEWKTAWFQFLLRYNGIEFTGKERTKELEKKLTDVGVPFSPPTPPKVLSAIGTTNNPNTTSIFSGTAYVLPDPQISVSMKKGQKAVIQGTVCLSTGSGATVSSRMSSLAYSTNEGVTWTNIGSWINSSEIGSNIVPVSIGYSYTASADVNVIFGIRVASADGTTVVTAANNQRSIMATIY